MWVYNKLQPAMENYQAYVFYALILSLSLSAFASSNDLHF